MSTNTSGKVRVQKFGAFLSSEVMPNIGVFIGWGILAALFIPTGWLPNETLNQLVAPTMKYLMPTLIAYTGGSNVYGRRGGVIGAFATMGVILGSEVNMLAGAMIMGPFAAWCLKKVDAMFAGRIKPGLEMMINNFTLGILGAILMVIGFFTFAPVIMWLIGIFSIAINWLITHGLLPFMAFFVQPGKVLFLNNAINHGIMIPLGTEQAAEVGNLFCSCLKPTMDASSVPRLLSHYSRKERKRTLLPAPPSLTSLAVLVKLFIRLFLPLPSR